MVYSPCILISLIRSEHPSPPFLPGGWVEPPTKFSKRGVLETTPSFLEGFDGKEEGDLFEWGGGGGGANFA